MKHSNIMQDELRSTKKVPATIAVIIQVLSEAGVLILAVVII